MPKRTSRRLTDLVCRQLRLAPGKNRAEVTDSEPHGLALRLSGSGLKTWWLRYGPIGSQRRYRLGQYPAMRLDAAREAARALLAQVDQGSDPQGERRADRLAETFGELATDWLAQAQRRKRPRSYAEDVRKLKVEVLPSWEKRRLESLRRRDVLHLLERIATERGGVCSNRTRSLIHAIFAYGVRQELLEANPASSVPKLHVERPRERVLTRSEVAALWRALDSEHPVVASAWRLILLTAQRPGEVQSMRWDDLTRGEGSNSWWQLRGTVAKSGTGHRVPLSNLAVSVIESLRPLTGSTPWVLSYRQGKQLGNLAKSTPRIISRAGLPHFTPHDLRRTAATWLGELGFRPDLIDTLLGHTLSRITRTYNRATYDPEKRQAVDILAREVRGLLAIAAETTASPAGAATSGGLACEPGTGAPLPSASVLQFLPGSTRR
ncbi:MAG: tyrosine-type recombinase/integrase [Thermoanaerobaculia bacterium]|nr:tyrosine-type recombinase/integrase [Thermoanaerobaculia bacterium]